jgi:hypothetical protein
MESLRPGPPAVAFVAPGIDDQEHEDEEPEKQQDDRRRFFVP